MLGVPFVATALLEPKIDFSPVSPLKEALPCGDLLREIMTGLFPCRGILIGMTLLVNSLDLTVVTVCLRSSSV